jgi:hypothetical protein
MNAFTLSLIRGNFATVRVCMKVKTTTIRFASRFSLPCAWASVRKRGGEVGAVWRLGIAVNSGPSLNRETGKLRMLDAGPFGVSGGTQAGLKPSLAR